MYPWSGVSSPAMAFSAKLLPAPDGPMSTMRLRSDLNSTFNAKAPLSERKFLQIFMSNIKGALTSGTPVFR